MPKIHLVDPQPFQIGPRRDAVRPWGRPVVFDGKRDDAPMGQLDRVAKHAMVALGGDSSELGQISLTRWYRLLTPYQIDLIYQRCPDVRSSIDQVVRQIATHAWDVVPTVEMSDPQYAAALEQCLPIKRWLQKPTSDGFTFQEVMTSFLTDVLKHDAGAFERVRDRRGRLVEAVPLRGCDVHPIQDVHGRLDHYAQIPYTPSMVDYTSTASSTRLETDQVLYLCMFPNTMSPEGWPLLESLVNEVVTLLRAADFWAHSVDVNEIPPGLLVLAGVASDAAERMKAEYESKAASDWKIRILASPVPGDVSAEWVRFQRDPKELQIEELCDAIRRTVWRVFGVMPVEQGATEGMPRATAQVQLDASGSHLIDPLLALLKAKVNMLLVADLVEPEYLDLVEFRWVDHEELTWEEKLAREQALDAAIKNGSMTRNEARRLRGDDPYEDLEDAEDGDMPTVLDGKGGYVPLVDVLNPPDPVLDPNADPNATGGSGSGGSSDGGDPEGGDAPGDKAATQGDGKKGKSKAAKKPKPKASKARDLSPRRGIRHALAPAARSSVAESPPPGWLRADVRSALTVDLDRVWEEMRGYWRDVDPLWERALERVLEAIASEPVLDAQARARIQSDLAVEVTSLAIDWALATRPRYRAVAEASRRVVGDWAGTSSDAAEIRSDADTYHLRAVGFLTAEDGLLTDLAREVMRVLTEDYDGATRASRAVPGGTSVTGAISAVANVWGSLRHRIGNWVSKLYALANVTLSAQAQRAAAQFNPADPLWAEWADVGPPGECQNCIDLGSKGWVELSTLNGQVPADGQTQCRANCRCVLRIFRKSEIDDGTATLSGHGNTNPIP